VVNIVAAALTPDMTVIYPNRALLILAARVRDSGRMIDTQVRYTRCDFEPTRVGQEWGVSFRVGTELEVLLPAAVQLAAVTEPKPDSEDAPEWMI